jgi:alanyl-tRNA synthetase
MERQRAAARKAWTGSGDVAADRHWFEIRDDTGASEFLGYGADVAEAQVLALVADGEQVEQAAAGDEVSVVVNQTPFYAESGGQIGDTGIMFAGDGLEVAVSDTQKRADTLFVHIGKVTKGTLKRGAVVELRIDGERRTRLRANHSVTHLAHEALRRRLGDHVTQKGSQVAPDRMRFDFSHPKALTGDDIRGVEADVNARIRQNGEVVTRLMSPEEAVEAGALALFGEKYGEEVRVVSMGGDDGGFYSTELCGGTHVWRTGDIGLFKIVGESAVASGIRRIEVVTGAAAEAHVEAQERALGEAASALKTAPHDVAARVTALVEERKRLERELTEARRAAARGDGGEGAGARDVGGVTFAARRLDDVPAKELKAMVDDLKRQIGSGVVAIAAVSDGKASLVVGVTDDLTDRYDAVEFVRVGSAKLGGKGGGGRPDMAQAGGPDGAAAEAALTAIEARLAAL